MSTYGRNGTGYEIKVHLLSNGYGRLDGTAIASPDAPACACPKQDVLSFSKLSKLELSREPYPNGAPPRVKSLTGTR